LKNENPIGSPNGPDIKYGQKVYYYNEREVDLNRRIIEGTYIAGSSNMELTPKQILTQLVNSEHELKQFCEENSIHVAEKEHMWGAVIEAYNFLNKKFTTPEVQRPSSNQTSCTALSLVDDSQPKSQPVYTTVSSVAANVAQAAIQEVATVGRKRTYHELVAGDNGATINQHILSDEDITLTPVRAASGQSPSKKLVLPCSSARRARLRAIMSKKKAKPAAVIAPNKKNASRILPLEKIDVSYDGTPREPILERIAPGVNVKDVRTWVFYFSIRGRLCRAAKEKQLRGKPVVYLNCSNKFKHRCRWKIKMEMRNPNITPDMDEYSFLENWVVLPNEDPQDHVDESCWVEGIKHYNSKHAQELREARGQRLIIENGEVKDVSPNVSLATRTPTVTRTGRVIRKPEDPDFEHQIVESQDGNVYEITEETMVTDQDHVDEDVDESSLEQDDTMDMSDAPGTAGPDSIELIKVGTDSQEKNVPTSTSSLINEASKMVGLPMSSPGSKATDVKAEKADDK